MLKVAAKKKRKEIWIYFIERYYIVRMLLHNVFNVCTSNRVYRNNVT